MYLLDKGTKRMSNEILSRINCLKIPHHGSAHSNEFYERVKNSTQNRLTTTVIGFNPSQDPKKAILKVFRESGDVYYMIDYKQDQFGCIETIVELTQCHRKMYYPTLS